MGAKAELSAAHHGFPVAVDEHGRSSVPWLFACGTAAGRGLLDETDLAGGGMVGAPSNIVDVATMSGNASRSPARELARRAGAQAAREAGALAAAEGDAQAEAPVA